MNVPNIFISKKDPKLVERLLKKETNSKGKKDDAKGLLFLVAYNPYVCYWEPEKQPVVIKDTTLKKKFATQSIPTSITFTENDIYYSINKDVYSASDGELKYSFEHDVLTMTNHQGKIYAGTLKGDLYQLGKDFSKKKLGNVRSAISEFCILENRLCYITHRSRTEVRDIFTDNLVLAFKLRMVKLASIGSDIFYIGSGEHASDSIHRLSEDFPIHTRYNVVKELCAFEGNLLYSGFWNTNMIIIEPEMGLELNEISTESLWAGNVYIHDMTPVPKKAISRYTSKNI